MSVPEPDHQSTGNFILRGWKNVRQAGPLQLTITGLFLLLALFVARYSWTLPNSDEPTPLISDAERAMFDLRSYYFAEMIEQDDRVVLVVYDDQTLINARKRSPLDRGILADALQTLDAMEPKAIGLDILFDQPQDEDLELIETLRAMNTPVAVAYGNVATNESEIVYEQQQYLETFLASLEGTNARPASIRLDNAFGTTRTWPNIEPDLPPLLGRAMIEDADGVDQALPGYEGVITYRRQMFEDSPLIPSLQIDLFADPDPAIIPFLAEQIRGKYVLIGGDIVDYDRVDTSFTSITGEQPPGLAVHGEMIAQMLDGKAKPRLLPVTLWAFALLVIVSAALTALLEWRRWRVVPLLGAQFVLFVGVPIILEARGLDTYGMPAVGWLAGWIIAFTAATTAARASGAVQRNFAQSALGKYLPRDIARSIIDRPELLALHGEKKEIYVLFSDLEGFTKMSHAIEPEMVARLLNRYLEMLSQVVLDHGGVIDKFVGDAVVAFWGAPIAKPDDATRAAKAGYAIWQAGEAFRKEVAEMDATLPLIGKTRVGLHFGEAVIGNFGGKSRIQYTALGDSMNTAARLEAANKMLDSSVMASKEFAERSGLDWWRAMGKVQLRGRAQAVEIFEPAPEFPDEDRRALSDACTLADSDAHAAILAVEEVVAGHPDDLALQNLLYRMRNLGEGGAYVLG